MDDEGVRARRPASFFEVPKKVEPRLPAHYVQVPVQRGRDESNSASDDDSSYEDEAEAEEVMSNKRIDATYKLRDGAAFEPSHNTIDTGLAVGFGTPSPAKLTQYECI